MRGEENIDDLFRNLLMKGKGRLRVVWSAKRDAGQMKTLFFFFKDGSLVMFSEVRIKKMLKNQEVCGLHNFRGLTCEIEV